MAQKQALMRDNKSRKRKTIDRSILQGEAVQIFRSALRNPNTRDPYERHLISFLNHVKMDPDTFVRLAREKPKEVEKILISYVDYLVERVEHGELARGTIKNPIKVIKLLLEMNDIATINWRRIRRLLPTARGYAMDRIPTMDEIREIYEGSDLRGKALTLLLLSSGIREGAIQSLTISDWSPIYRDKKLVAGKLMVYNGEPERYFTFITVECYHAVEKYLEFRRDHGEELGHKSPLFRDKFDPVKGHTSKTIEPMSPGAVRQYYNRLLHSVGIRKEKQKRHQFSVHGFRKAYKTICELGGMKPINIEILLNHTVGISDSYFRPTETQLLDDYVSVSDQLTINDVTKLKAEVQNITQLTDRVSSLETVIKNMLETDTTRDKTALAKQLINAGVFKPKL